jgi:hypothetical protein
MSREAFDRTLRTKAIGLNWTVESYTNSVPSEKESVAVSCFLPRTGSTMAPRLVIEMEPLIPKWSRIAQPVPKHMKHSFPTENISVTVALIAALRKIVLAGCLLL